MGTQRRGIARWMAANAERFEDRRTGEIDLTRMVEAWDAEQDDGESTLDPDHPAWEVAYEVSERYERAARRAS